jgi:hypothetical protein
VPREIVEHEDKVSGRPAGQRQDLRFGPPIGGIGPACRADYSWVMDGVEDPVAGLEKATFEVVLRGYRRTEVDDALRRMRADRDSAVVAAAKLAKELDAVRHELAETRATLRRLTSDPSSAATMTERVRAMMRLAEEEIAETRAQVEREVAEQRGELLALHRHITEEFTVTSEAVQAALALLEPLDEEKTPVSVPPVAQQPRAS